MLFSHLYISSDIYWTILHNKFINRTQTHTQKGEEIFKRDNWINSFDMNWESEDLKAQAEKLSYYVFEGYKKDEVVETDDLEDIWL